MDNYNRTNVAEVIKVKKIVTIFYDEFSSQFYSDGEKHDFWEFIYIDKGEFSIKLDDTVHIVTEGELMFYPPQIHHSGGSNNKATNAFIVSFECEGIYADEVQNKKIKLNDNQKNILAEILKDGVACFEMIPKGQNLSGMRIKKNVSDLKIQTVKIRLELFLIDLINKEQNNADKNLSTNQYNYNNDVVNQIVIYLKNNISRKITLDEISQEVGLSTSYIKKIFKHKFKCGIIDYFITLKLEKSKLMIREDNMNFSQIAESLGFSSVHYFSKIFKEKTNMTPTEYSKSIL